jgi:hypothetical protein
MRTTAERLLRMANQMAAAQGRPQQALPQPAAAAEELPPRLTIQELDALPAPRAQRELPPPERRAPLKRRPTQEEMEAAVPREAAAEEPLGEFRGMGIPVEELIEDYQKFAAAMGEPDIIEQNMYRPYGTPALYNLRKNPDQPYRWGLAPLKGGKWFGGVVDGGIGLPTDRDAGRKLGRQSTQQGMVIGLPEADVVVRDANGEAVKATTSRGMVPMLLYGLEQRGEGGQWLVRGEILEVNINAPAFSKGSRDFAHKKLYIQQQRHLLGYLLLRYKDGAEKWRQSSHKDIVDTWEKLNKIENDPEYTAKLRGVEYVSKQ